jgi:C-terminal processing protease CtpA/Prc
MLTVNTLPNHEHVGFTDQSWTVAPATPRLTARLIILSGGAAISAAETTLGVVEGNRLGDIVGEPSAGTNGRINPFDLPGGYTVNWTGVLTQKRDGTQHHGVGILPTVPVSPTVAGIRAGRDEVLERAISLVTSPPLRRTR